MKDRPYFSEIAFPVKKAARNTCHLGDQDVFFSCNSSFVILIYLGTI